MCCVREAIRVFTDIANVLEVSVSRMWALPHTTPPTLTIAGAEAAAVGHGLSRSLAWLDGGGIRRRSFLDVGTVSDGKRLDFIFESGQLFVEVLAIHFGERVCDIKLEKAT